MKIEGIVSKLASSPYKANARNATWQKIKCVARQEFVIGGYERSVRDDLGALWLGTYEDGRNCCSLARSARASSARRPRS